MSIWNMYCAPSHGCIQGPHGRCPICFPCNMPGCCGNPWNTAGANSWGTDFRIPAEPTPPPRVAQKCPVCSGSGKKWEGMDTTGPHQANCHGCDGRGWVTP